jgi:hypothetical protein
LISAFSAYLPFSVSLSLFPLFFFFLLFALFSTVCHWLCKSQPNSKAQDSDTSGSDVCISVCLTSLIICAFSSQEKCFLHLAKILSESVSRSPFHIAYCISSRLVTLLAFQYVETQGQVRLALTICHFNCVRHTRDTKAVENCTVDLGNQAAFHTHTSLLQSVTVCPVFSVNFNWYLSVFLIPL